MSTIMDIGERGVIELLWRHFTKSPEELLGLWDDAVAMEVKGGYLTLHTDVLVESSDILPGMKPWNIGWKAVIMNISDLASKGVKPMGALVAIGLPSTYKISDLEDLSKGIEEACEAYGFHVLGGDTSQSKELFIAICIFGISRERPVSRRGAKPGDLIVTTGLFGLTSIAYKVLLQNYVASDNILKKCLDSVYKPIVKLDEGLKLSKYVSSMMDVSDGLALSLHYISELNNVKIVIDNPPIHEAVYRFANLHGLDPVKLAFNEGGEEYELLATIPENELARIDPDLREKLIKIGYVTEGSGVYLRSNREEIPIKKQGWQHYKKWNIR